GIDIIRAIENLRLYPCFLHFPGAENRNGFHAVPQISPEFTYRPGPRKAAGHADDRNRLDLIRSVRPSHCRFLSALFLLVDPAWIVSSVSTGISGRKRARDSPEMRAGPASCSST